MNEIEELNYLKDCSSELKYFNILFRRELDSSHEQEKVVALCSIFCRHIVKKLTISHKLLAASIYSFVLSALKNISISNICKRLEKRKYNVKTNSIIQVINEIIYIGSKKKNSIKSISIKKKFNNNEIQDTLFNLFIKFHLSKIDTLNQYRLKDFLRVLRILDYYGLITDVLLKLDKKSLLTISNFKNIFEIIQYEDITLILRFFDLTRFQKFSLYYAFCPRCKRKNHYKNLHRWYYYLTRIENYYLREQMVDNIDHSNENKINKIQFGILCCICAENFFNKHQ